MARMALKKIKNRIVHDRTARSRVSFAIEATTACNLSCGFCFHGAGARGSAVIPLDEFNEILKWTEIFSPSDKSKKKAISPSAAGEFFLLRDACDYLSSIREISPGASICVASNFTIFHDGVIERMISENLVDQLTCSMNFSTSEQYAEICGSDELENVFKNLDKVVSEIEKTGSSLVIDVAMKKTAKLRAGEMTKFEHDAAARWGRRVKVSWNPVTCWGGHIDFQGHVPDAPAIEAPCSGLAFPAYLVKAGGDAYPCCCCATVDSAPELLLGNVFKDSKEHIKSSRKKLLDIHKRGEWKSLKLCSTCNIYSSDEFDIYFKAGRKFL